MSVEAKIYEEPITRGNFEDWALGIERCVAARKAVSIITDAIRRNLLTGAISRTDIIEKGLVVVLPKLIAAPVGAFAVANGQDPKVGEFDQFMLNSIHRHTDGQVFLHSAIQRPDGAWDVRIFIC